MSQSRLPPAKKLALLRSMRTVTTYAFPPVRDATFEPLVEALDHSLAPSGPAFRWDGRKETAMNPDDRNLSTEHQTKGAAANPSDTLDRGEESVVEKPAHDDSAGSA